MSNEVVVIVRAPGIDGVFHFPIEHLNELLDWLVALSTHAGGQMSERIIIRKHPALDAATASLRK